MKNWNPIHQVILTSAFIGFGTLCGLALATMFHDLDTRGVAPLFANSIGAGIGAAITLWVADRRAEAARVAERRDHLKTTASELLQISALLSNLHTDLSADRFTQNARTSLFGLAEHLENSGEIISAAFSIGRPEVWTALSHALISAKRVVTELSNQPSHNVTAVASDGNYVEILMNAEKLIDKALEKFPDPYPEHKFHGEDA